MQHLPKRLWCIRSQIYTGFSLSCCSRTGHLPLLSAVYSCFRFASSHYIAAPDIPGCQILQCAAPFILIFYAGRPARRGRKRMMTAEARLNARFLIRTENIISGIERFAFPESFIQFQNRIRFFGKPGISRKYPIFVTPWSDGVIIQNPPHRGSAYAFVHSILSASRDISQ